LRRGKLAADEWTGEGETNKCLYPETDAGKGKIRMWEGDRLTKGKT